MINVDTIILGDEPSQAAPVCNRTVRELIDEIKRLRHDNSEIIKNCMTISEVETMHKLVIRELWKSKEGR